MGWFHAKLALVVLLTSIITNGRGAFYQTYISLQINLPQEVLEEFAPERRIRVPMLEGSRSLNLSNAVAVVVYEAWRQLGFAAGRASIQPEADDMDVASIHGGFLKGARAAGARILEGVTVTGFTTANGGVTGVLTDHGPIETAATSRRSCSTPPRTVRTSRRTCWRCCAGRPGCSACRRHCRLAY